MANAAEIYLTQMQPSGRSELYTRVDVVIPGTESAGSRLLNGRVPTGESVGEFISELAIEHNFTPISLRTIDERVNIPRLGKKPWLRGLDASVSNISGATSRVDTYAPVSQDIQNTTASYLGMSTDSDSVIAYRRSA